VPIINSTIVDLVQETSIKTSTASLVSQFCWQLMTTFYKSSMEDKTFFIT